MDHMQRAQEYLRQYQDEQRIILRLLGRADTLRTRASSITVKLSDMPCSDSPNPQRAQEDLEAAIDLEAEAAEKQQALRALRRQMLERISGMPSALEQDVLVSRYLDGLSWEEASLSLHYSQASLYRVHREALEHLGSILCSAQE